MVQSVPFTVGTFSAAQEIFAYRTDMFIAIITKICLSYFTSESGKVKLHEVPPFADNIRTYM
jgi:hypothetical protein